jgi:uncharacterized protein (DUF4415 family)
MKKSITFAIQANNEAMKKPFTFRLDADLVEDVRKIGELDNRKLTPAIENILITFVQEHKMAKAKKSNGKQAESGSNKINAKRSV